MDKDLRSKVSAILESLSLEERQGFENKLNTLEASGIDSQEAMLRTVINLEADRNLRIQICWTLLYFGETVALGPLISILQNNSDIVEIRRAAAEVLSWFRSKNTVEELSNLLTNDEDEEIRRIAAHALGRIGESSVSDKLLHQFQQPQESPKVRAEIAESLAYTNAKQSIPSLLKGLKDENAEVRFWSAFALGHLADTGVIPELEKVSSDENQIENWGTVGKEALDAIEHIRKRIQPMES
jgi:HEAT repeat protein